MDVRCKHAGRIALAGAAFASLAACGSSHHRGQSCLQSHREFVPPTYVMAGKVLIPVGGGMETKCDLWGPKPGPTS